MDCAAVATYGEQGRKSRKNEVVDSTAYAQQKVRLAPWLRRATLACGLLTATAPWSGALADVSIADALSLVGQGRYAEAREILEPMLRQQPDSPEVRLLHGVLEARQGNLADAVVVFEGLRTDHPTMFEAHNNLAVLYARVGRLDDARDALVAASELRSDPVVYANLGDVYMKLAERAYKRAHELRDADPATAEEGGQAFAASEPEQTKDEPPAVVEPEQTTDEPPATAAPVEAGHDGDAEAAEAEAEDPPSPAEPEAAPDQGSGAACVRAGWFEERAAAGDAADWMRSAGAEAVEIRQEEQQVIKNYQVYLPPASSREAARSTANELRDKGVSDIWIIDRGTQANGISLGVYRSKGNTNRRVAQMEELGYSVLTTANMKTVTMYAVEAEAAGDHSAVEDAWNDRFQDYAIRRVDCAD